MSLTNERPKWTPRPVSKYPKYLPKKKRTVSFRRKPQPSEQVYEDFSNSWRLFFLMGVINVALMVWAWRMQ